MRKAVSLLLTLALCLTLLPAPACAAVVASGYCGDPEVNDGRNVTWSLDDAGTLTISGTGKMKDYGRYLSLGYGSTNVKAAVIQSGVTSIGNMRLATAAG